MSAKIEIFLQEVLQNRKNVLKLSRQELIELKRNFYKLPLSRFQLDVLWEVVWNDMTPVRAIKYLKIKGGNSMGKNNIEVAVIANFNDIKDNYKERKVGETLMVDAERYEYLSKKGFVRLLEKDTEIEKKTKKKVTYYGNIL